MSEYKRKRLLKVLDTRNRLLCIRITKKSKYINTVTVKVMINDIFKEMDISSGKNFKEDEDVYILAYGDNSNQMELFKESEFTEFL